MLCELEISKARGGDDGFETRPGFGLVERCLKIPVECAGQFLLAVGHRTESEGPQRVGVFGCQ